MCWTKVGLEKKILKIETVYFIEIQRLLRADDHRLICLAKVGVASSSLVFRSKQASISWPAFFYRGLELATRSPRELPAGAG